MSDNSPGATVSINPDNTRVDNGPVDASGVNDDLAQCILALARIHGINTTYEALTAGLPLVRQRLMPSTFGRAASRLGFSSRVVKRRLQDLNAALFPVMLVMKNGRACMVTERIAGEETGYRVMFPDLPESTVFCTHEELADNYSGLAIYCRLSSPLNDTRVGIPGGTRKHWFWDVIKDNRRIYRDVLIAALFINLFALAMPLFVMNVYDRVVPNRATETLWVLAAGIFLVFCADLTLRLLRGWYTDLAASRADVKLSSTIMTQVLGLRMDAKPESVGSFASSINSFESIRAFMSSMTILALIDLPFVLLFATVIALIALPLVVPIVIGATLVLLYALAVQKTLHKLSEEVWQAGAQRSGLLVENIQALDTVKSFNAESRVQNVWERTSVFLADRGARLRSLGLSVSSGAQWLQHVCSVSIIVVGVYLIIDQQISQGGLIAAYLLSSRAMAPVSQVASLLTQYFQSANSMSSLNELMAKPVDRPEGKRWLSRPNLQGKIELQSVSLTYPNSEQPALKNISLRIQPGEHVAIIGRTGSGKSSIQKLVNGLYQPTSGKILIDDANISQIDPGELRQQIGYISQDVVLLNGTLHENITLAAPHADAERITRAINISGLGSLIQEHPDGINMRVGEQGQFLSGGQRQAVAIARAVIHEPRILLFDEPSSFLDNTLEAHVKSQLARFIRRRTLILVTHRTALLDLVDRLIVMDNGEIKADGPKESVLTALQSAPAASATPATAAQASTRATKVVAKPKVTIQSKNVVRKATP